MAGNVIGLVQAFEQCNFRQALVILNRDFICNTLTARITENSEVQAEPSDSSSEDQSKANKTKVKPELPTKNIPFGRELGGLRFDVPYLQDKGITVETAKDFGVGYCSRGLMKSRVVFPIKNREGIIMSYSGRTLKENEDKYRFPAGFNKSLELFNIDRICNNAETKKAVLDFGIIIVEGFTDAMKLWQEGFKNVVALMGSDFQVPQKNILLDPQVNPTRRITLFLDNNDAGNRGKRKIARDCIHNAFIRYANYSRVDDPQKTEPEHFAKEELTAILGFKNIS